MNQIQSVSKNAIFTICSVNYINKALALFISALKYNPDVDFILVLADKKRPIEIKNIAVKIIWAEDLFFPDYLKCAFKYNIIEFNTAIKPFAAIFLLGSYEKIIYLDPDTCVFGSFGHTFSLLDQHDAIFTPITTRPYLDNHRPNNIDLLRFGSNCLGFFAVNSSANAKSMLEWWHSECFNNCFYDPSIGQAVDQKWIDLAPAFFENILILRDPGLNVAFWNLHERVLNKINGIWKVNNKYNLLFMHFSSFSDEDEDVVADKQTRFPRGSRQDFIEVAKEYRVLLKKSIDDFFVSDKSYGYSVFDNGDAISAALRRFYAVSDQIDVQSADDPFNTGGSVYRFAKTNGLISTLRSSTTHKNFKIASAYTRERKIITKAFRFALRLLGPDRYFNLMRYLAHYSSLLNQADLLRK